MSIWAVVSASALQQKPCLSGLFPSPLSHLVLVGLFVRPCGELDWKPVLTFFFFFFPTRLFFVHLHLFPDLAYHVAQPTTVPVWLRLCCRGVNRSGAGWHCQGAEGSWSCGLSDLIAIQHLKDYIFVLFCSLLNGHSIENTIINFFKCFYRALTHHLSWASPRVPSVS